MGKHPEVEAEPVPTYMASQAAYANNSVFFPYPVSQELILLIYLQLSEKQLRRCH